jgi:microcin C transport system substrate-binding protein
LNARSFQRACATAPLIAIPVLTAVQADAEQDDWRHGLSVYGDLKYKPDFKHFDYGDLEKWSSLVRHPRFSHQ